ncbi:PKD domain-containing protein [Deinococcus sp. KSM4-11]|uniref:PKD domain-containing protein n=1 Tax=Deinococcus sp. KSM4-11 TaxID=2568654 RepID=UPI0010A42258|nr:PKD domain-containing protein [Deinococcus sp. KSM4-11]THF87203.1 PKD domain-containing protein [Deinococcus sp. KSM4-11]
MTVPIHKGGWLFPGWLATLIFMLSGLSFAQTTVPVLVVTPNTVQLRSIVTADSTNLDPDRLYTLDWGDSETDSLNAVTTAQTIHNYRQPGTYTVTLSTDGGVPAIQTVTVTFPMATAVATASALDVTLNLGNLLVDYPYEIAWGDDAVETVYPNDRAVQVPHPYLQPGTYVIRVTPQNAAPVITTVTLLYPAPILALTPGQVAAGQPVTANVSGLQPTLPYRLDWGDGTVETLTGDTTSQKTHVYAQPGAYTVTVTSTGTAPATGVVSATVPTPVIVATASALTATLNLSHLLAGYAYSVSYGDGVTEPLVPTADTAVLTHSYAAPGTSTIQVTPTGAAPATTTVTLSVPTPILSATSTALTATLNVNTLLAGYGYVITWDDSTSEPLTPSGASAQLTHSYRIPGTYTVQVTPRGSAPATTTVTVNAPNSVMTVTPSSATVRQTITATLATLVPGLTYRLDWMDGTVDTLTGVSSVQKTHHYAQPGTYTVTLTSPGTTPVTAIVSATVPAPMLTATLSALTASLNLGTLVSGYPYAVAWGDQATEPLTPTSDTAVLSHPYQAPGTYTIQVTPQGTAPATTTVRTNVPNPGLSVTPAQASVRQTMTANLTSLVPALSYTVDYGDDTSETITGESATQRTHLYYQPGTYTVTLSSPGTTPATATVTVSVPVPVLNATASGLNVTLNLSRLLSEYVYQIVWNDGTTESLPATSDTAVLTHRYTTPGPYTIQISTQGGPPATTTITVAAPNSVLTITPGTAAVRQTITADLSALTPTLIYTLEWKDGTTETITGVTTAQKTHAYQAPGTYTVTVSAPGTAPTTVTVTVSVPAPVLTATATDLTATVNLSNLLSGYAYSIEWNDGTTEPLTPTSTAAQLTHTYLAPGTYTVQVAAQGAAPVTTSVTITAPEIGLSVTPTTAALFQQLTATVTGLIPTSGARLSWGDDTVEPLIGTGTVQRTHAYAVAGNYLVQVNANIVPVHITVLAPTATATAANLAVTLHLGHLIPGYTYRIDWEFNGSETLVATGQTAEVTHTYARPGTVTPVVTPLGGDGVPTTLTITATSAVVNVTPASLTVGGTVTVALSNLLPITYSLEYGDGAAEFVAPGSAMTRSHTYATLGTFTVTLSAPDTVPVTAPVTVTAPTPVLSVAPTSVTVHQPVTANLSNLRGELSYVLEWQDGTTETITGVTTAQRTHAYTAAGNYTVKLTSSGTSPVTATVTASLPVPTATVSDTALLVTLNLSHLLSGSAYQIEWGDVTTDTLNATASTASLTHTYAQPGTYTVKISTPGVDPVSVTTTVRASGPVLTVTPAEVNNRVQVQVGQTVTATLTNLVPALTYELTWDDGTVDPVTGVTSAARTHVYLREGNFSIRTAQAQGYTTRDFLVVVTLPAPAFTATAVQLDATATLNNLIPVVTYRFDWADGSPPVTVTGVTTATLMHHYTTPGDYSLQLQASDRVGVRLTLNVHVDGAGLSVSAAGLQATARISDLQPELTYTLNWSDGTSETLTGVTTAERSHTYALPGTYTVTLAAPRVPGVSASVTTAAEAPVSKVSATNLTATAELTGLLPGVTYFFDWGDGAGQYLKDQATVSLTHVYAEPGTYSIKVGQQPYGIQVPGVLGASSTLTVGLPPTEAVQLTSQDDQGATSHFRMTGLLPEGTYRLDFGDGSTSDRLSGAADAAADHTYQRSGTYTVTLLFQTYTGTVVRATLVNPVKIALSVQFGTLIFSQPNRSTDLTLYSTDPIEAVLTVTYRGGGRLTGRWMLDGQPAGGADVTLPDVSGQGTAEVKFARTETKPGPHSLSFEVTSPSTLSIRPITYTLYGPDTLNYNGFKVAIKTITRLSSNPGSSVTVSGTGTARLIVSGTQLSDVDVTFEGQTAGENGVIREGTVTVDMNGAAVRNARLGDLKVGLSQLRLNQDGATLDGIVTLPGAASPYSFTGAALKADTGDLIATLKAAVQNLKLPEDGLSFSAGTAVLDLSGTENPTGLAAAYNDQAAQQHDWMGVVFPAASLTVGAPILSQPVTLTLPLAFNLSGYVTTLNLPTGTTDLLGWNVNLSSLHASVLAGRIGTTTGAGRVILPLVNEPMDVTLGWNTNARAGERFTFTAPKDASVKSHNFGRTSLALGEGVWTPGPTGATVTFANAHWYLDNQGNDVSMNNLIMAGNGDVSLDGRPWASISGKTALTVLGYPLAAAEVGVQRQSGGAYTLGLNGKLQVNEQLPVGATNAPTLFWVQGGKDAKVTTEAQHLTGELANVPYDINLTPAFTDQGRLEFTGTGKMTVAHLLNVDAKASFGRFTGTNYGYFHPNTSGSVGYGSVTAILSANPDLGKPLVSVKRVELYELHGGLTVNMDWPNGLDAAPVFREAGPNLVFQAGALLSVKQDPGTPVKPFLNGLLSVDTGGQFDMKADLWLVKDGQKLARNAPNGRALVSVSGERVLIQACVGPNGGSLVGGLNCAGVAELNLYDLMTLRGSLELYAPFSGSDQHLYIGTRANPISVKVPSYPEGQGYLMIDPSSVRAGAGVTWGFEKGNSGSLVFCSWYWNIKATASLNADFGITYNPAALDGHVNFSANAAASAGGCGIGLSASAAMIFDGNLHVASAGNYFDGSVSASVSLPVIPNIDFKVNTKVKF